MVVVNPYQCIICDQICCILCAFDFVNKGNPCPIKFCNGESGMRLK